MAWRQTISPNCDTDPNNPLYVWIGGEILTDWYGWCLACIAAAYSAQGSSYSAKTAWQSCPTKHYDRNIPEYMWVPLWYEGGTYGHVVMGFRQGNGITIYSSPYTHKPTFDRFDGELNWALDYIGQVYGVGSFTGWSETVLDTRVLEWVNEQAPAPQEPEPTPEPEPEPEPTPEPDEPSEPSDEPTEPTKDDDTNEEPKEDDSMSQPTEPAKPYQDQQQVMSLIEDAGEGFDFPKNVKFIAYLVGDALLVASLLIPDIVNTLQAPDGAIWAEYMSKVLLEGGIAILTVFKLFKKKK